jgi:hypothetical protein
MRSSEETAVGLLTRYSVARRTTQIVDGKAAAAGVTSRI